MKNYADKSDEEINIEVAELREVNWWLPPSNSSSGGWEYCKLPELITKQDCKLPDYCSDWSDAGPVMVENRIGIYPSEGPDFMPWMASPVGSGLLYTDKNPLRAAMIAFLMMKDAAK